MKALAAGALAALILMLPGGGQVTAFEREWMTMLLPPKGATRAARYNSSGLIKGEFAIGYIFHDQSKIPHHWMFDPDGDRNSEPEAWKKEDYKRLADLNRRNLDAARTGIVFYNEATRQFSKTWEYMANPHVDRAVEICRLAFDIDTRFTDPTHTGFRKIADCVSRIVRDQVPVKFVTRYDHSTMSPEAPMERVLTFGIFDAETKEYTALTPTIPGGTECTSSLEFSGGKVAASACGVCYPDMDLAMTGTGEEVCGTRAGVSMTTAVLSWRDVYPILKRANGNEELAVQYYLANGSTYTVRVNKRALLSTWESFPLHYPKQ